MAIENDPVAARMFAKHGAKLIALREKRDQAAADALNASLPVLAEGIGSSQAIVIPKRKKEEGTASG